MALRKPIMTGNPTTKTRTKTTEAEELNEEAKVEVANEVEENPETAPERINREREDRRSNYNELLKSKLTLRSYFTKYWRN